MFAVNQPPYYAYAGEKTLGGMLCNTSGVAIDENGRALPVPGLILESPEQEAEWEGGKRRYELRKERHREGF